MKIEVTQIKSEEKLKRYGEKFFTQEKLDQKMSA